MSNYKLKFTLKQHTPIIHFQHDQHGATLRASELKPKLDKFLIENAFGGILNFEAYKQYLIGDVKSISNGLKIIDKKTDISDKDKNQKKIEFLKKQKLAFNYKVKIKSINVVNDEISKGDRIPNYFANMGSEFKDNPKSFSYSDNIFIITVFVENELKKSICDYFPEFIAKTNFGTRQNKGFGSFYLTEKSDCYRSIQEVLKPYYYIEINSLKNDLIYASIDYYYKRLKAGINNNFNSLCSVNPNCNSQNYNKSFIFKYSNIGWEKRWIKETFFGLYSNDVEKFFLRALLGIPGSYSYKPTIEPCYKKNDDSIDASYKIEDDYEIEVFHSEIKRFKSPITFRPIKFGKHTRIYIIPNKTYENILTTNDPFRFYKKNIANYAYVNHQGYLRFSKEKPFPNIDGSKTDEAKRILQKLKKQENNLQNLIEINDKDENDKRKKRNNCTLTKIIKGQKERFESFLSDCIINNHKYFPPSSEISLPDSQVEFNIDDMIVQYNKELSNRFSFQVGRENYNASIKK